MAAPPSALIDALQDRYALERELGRGGMATVYLARDLHHGRLVALKVLRPELAAVVGRERFARETTIAARLNHPHILPLFEARSFTTTGEPGLYYTMPYVEGRSLRVRLREEPQLPLEEAVGIARQVLDALDYAHQQGIVHRDIKPDNVLLAGQHALVADFGIARALDASAGERLTETGLALGTPAYMSPEQAAGSARPDGRTDIYALGVVLYEMLAGQPPFTGPTPQAILARHAVDPPPPLRTVRPALPAALGQVVMRALAKVPADRFSTAKAFADALAAASSSAISEPARDGSAPTAVTPAPRGAVARRRRALAVGAAGVAIIAGGLAVTRERKPPALVTNRVLVAPLQNRTRDSTLNSLGEIAADDIARGVAATGLVEVVDARSEAKARDGRGTDAGGARALARAVGAGHVVWGAYDRTPGDSVRLQAQMLVARTGRVVRSIDPVGAPAVARIAAVEGVRQRVTAALATLLGPNSADWQGASLPATYEAYQAFLAGEGMWADDCENAPLGGGCAEQAKQALEHFRRAAAIDSNFPLPLTRAAVAYWVQRDCARVDSIAVLLQPRLERLPPVDRAHLEIATNTCSGDRRMALTAARKGLGEAPANPMLAKRVAWMALRANQPRVVIESLERFDPANTPLGKQADYWELLLGAYHRLGMYDQQLKLIARGRRLERHELQVLFLQEEVAALSALGRLADAAGTINEGVRHFGPDQQGLAPTYLLEMAGQELAAHGHAAAAQQAFQRAIAWANGQSAERRATPESRLALAGVLRSAGRWDEALALYRSLAAADSTDKDVQAALAALAARRGDRAEAARIERWLAPDPGEAWRFELHRRARIAGLLGERERAIGLLRQAAEEGFLPWRLAHLDPDLAPLRADPAFQEWIRPKD